MRALVALILLAGTATADSHAIHGSITADKKPVEDATVTLTGVTLVATDCDPPSKCTVPAPTDKPIVVSTANDGTFTIASAPDGNYELTVTATGFRHRSRPVTLRKDRVIVVRLHRT